MIRLNAKQLSQNQLTVMLVMLAVVVWVIGLIISRALLGTILFNNKVIFRKRAVESTLNANIAKVDEIKANFEGLANKGLDTARVLRALPTQEDVPGLASKLEALMTASNVVFRSFGLESGAGSPSEGSTETTPAPGGQELQEFTYNIKVEGAYSGILQMLQNFEREITPMRIVTLKIQGTEQAASAELIVKAYFLPAVSLDFEEEALQ